MYEYLISVNIFINFLMHVLGILEETIKDYTNSDSEKFKTVVVFDSRGIDLLDCEFRVCIF